MDSRTLELDLAVDTGGTFTDVIGRRSDGEVRQLKVPSTPSNPALAVRAGADALLTELPGTIATLRHGTTVATNALLERRGARTLLITTHGFEDLLYLRRQNRPDIYAIHPTVPPPLVPREFTLGVGERICFDGTIRKPIEDIEAFIALHRQTFTQAESVAICFLHAYANPTHEIQLRDAIKASFPSLSLTLSSELVPLTREYERALTTVANAFVAPIMTRYLEDLSNLFPDTNISIMDSSGGLISLDHAKQEPVRTALSGPAGGVRGARVVGDQSGAKGLLALDMGGTSTDISIIQEDLLPSSDGRIGDLPLRTPMLPIETIGAGGGSIAFVDDGGVLKVGPRSAGSIPGPAAYGRAGANAEPTVTDAHVFLGRLPSLLSGTMPLDHQAARASIERLAAKLGTSAKETAEGIIQVASANIIRASKRALMANGADPRELSLIAFGGAGGLHACEIAQALGCKEVLFPPAPGVLSAQGILDAPRQCTVQQSFYAHESQFDKNALESALAKSLARTTQTMGSPNNPTRLDTAAHLDVRYAGQTHTLSIELSKLADPSLASIRAKFDTHHSSLFGWQLEKTSPIEIVALQVTATLPTASTKASGKTERPTQAPSCGPSALSSYSATLWLPEGWSAHRDPDGTYRCSSAATQSTTHQNLSFPLALEIHRQRLIAIAEEMGAALMRSAFSANIKERRDYSCALFDHHGNMLVQAAHIPVHLGSQPLSVAAAIRKGHIPQGTQVLLNDPYDGGTHLPDLTLVSPVYLSKSDTTPSFYVANRAHHADIGGITPGSMPAPFDESGNPRALTIDDEGFRIGPTPVTEALRESFAQASRTPKERYGDLRAQESANHVGVTRLSELGNSYRNNTNASLSSLNEQLLDYAERRMRSIIEPIPDGIYHFEDTLDSDGITATPIKLKATLTITGSSACIDFSEAPKAVASSINAVRSITIAAVHYVFRCLGPADLPTSGGLTRPITIKTREGSICDASYPAAVSAGNVETSQRLVDITFGALGQAEPGLAPAASCGTMNNILFGGVDPRPGPNHQAPFVHYETIAGGAGASSHGHGADAIHTHMTNTLNTPIEELERLFPVLVTRYARRVDSQQSNKSTYIGGRGLERHYTFLAPATVTLLSERRVSAPYGLAGGQSGQCGINSLVGLDGTVTTLKGQALIQVKPGETIRIATPGGGSYGTLTPD